MSHEHDHAGEHHGTRRTQSQKRLAITLVLTASYVVAEVIGGILANSLALMADAGHMLSDVAALGLSLFAIWIANRPATDKKTFGYYRMEILAALANGATLIAVTAYIFYEAYRRLYAPPEVQGAVVALVGTGGLVVSLLGMWLLNDGKSESINVHGAWLHMFTDALGSIGGIVAGLLVWGFGWRKADPILSIVIGLLVIYSSWDLLKVTVATLLEGTPAHIDLDEVRNALAGVPGVVSVHDLHVWTITSGMESLSAHVVVQSLDQHVSCLARLRDVLHEQFHIDHITIQLEPEGFVERKTPV